MHDQIQRVALGVAVAIQIAGMAGRRAMTERLRDERGMTTETVIITAVLASLAIAAAAIITVKVTGKAEEIPVD